MEYQNIHNLDVIGAVPSNGALLLTDRDTNTLYQIRIDTLQSGLVVEKATLLVDEQAQLAISAGDVHADMVALSDHDTAARHPASQSWVQDVNAHIGQGTIHFTEGSINHDSIYGAGFFSHANVDSHLNDTSHHFLQGDIYHGNIQDKGTNTHSQIDTHIADTGKHIGTISWTGVTYQNSWTDYSTTFHGVQYCKDSMGFVRLRGVCKPGNNTTIFTLPAGYRPSKMLIFFCGSTSAGAVAAVSVSSAGVVVGSHFWASVAFDGVNFQAEQ